ncbi:MAG: helix-turn-helix domain-containing protein [Candidatus Moranbacteria bacterium]|nr:helix-turn-helix domain-containing protein [Candidatus Moranbacteria bacterium]
MDTLEILKNIGFRDKKARVYRASLELGQANAQEISKKAEVERTSVYVLLESLEKEGLLSSTMKRKTKYYIPAHPEKLVEILEGKVDLMGKFLPLFVSLYKTSDVRPKIRFYEDRESIKEIFKDTLSCREKKIKSISSARDLLELLGKDFLNHHIEKRVKAGIETISLRLEEKEPEHWYLSAKNEEVLRTTRFLPKGIFFDVVCLIYDSKVALVSSKRESFGFIVESKEFSNFIKTIYDFLWKASK